MISSDRSSIRRGIYETLGEVVNAFASPVRLKMIQVLAQASRSVEELAKETGESVANTSQHLQRLANAGLVSWNRKGMSRIYQINNPKVLQLWEDLQDLAHEVDPTLNARESILTDPELLALASPKEILRAAHKGKALLIDVREEIESSATPIPGAQPLPLEKLKRAKSAKELGLSKSKPVYVICRGRYCSMASEAVQTLRKWNLEAYRLRESGFRLNMIDRGEV